MNSTLLLAGAHRGGESFSRAGVPALRNRIGEVLVADPVADRAKALAAHWSNSGVAARSQAQPGEAVVKRLWHEALAFVAIDRADATARVLERGCMIPVRWQILGRASGDDAPVLAFAGTVLPSNKALRGEAVALLRRLAMAVPEQSSRAVWDGSAFHQDALTALRGRVSARSLQEIVSLEERRSAMGKLELFWGTEVFPLQVEWMAYYHPDQEALWASRCALSVALETESHSDLAVAVLPGGVRGSPPSVQLFVIEARSYGGRVRLHQEFGSAAALTD
jgi:hypothetical protein